MNEYIEINDGQLIHLSKVKRIAPITQKERESLATLGAHVNAEKFQTRIESVA